MKKILIRTVSISAALVALIGFAHTKAGRPLLNALRGAPGCPVDFSGGDPVANEAYRVKQLALVASGHAASSRPALGFALGTSRRDDVVAALKARGAICELSQADTVLKCSKVPERAAVKCAAPINDAYLQFEPTSGVLVAVDLFRQNATGAQALEVLATKERALTKQVGPVTKVTGTLDAHTLDAQVMSRNALQYRYGDYVAELSATNLGDGGVKVREQYQWLPATTLASR